jgi:hypothetical protein
MTLRAQPHIQFCLSPLTTGPHEISIGYLKNAIYAAIVVCASLLPSVLPAISHSPDLSKKIAYLSLTTARSSGIEAKPDSFAPNVLVQFTQSDGPLRFLATTDRYGTATVPLEAGTYCAEAFGLDGQPTEISERSRLPLHRCFAIKAGTLQEFSLTIAVNAKYVQSLPLPSLGVE